MSIWPIRSIWHLPKRRNPALPVPSPEWSLFTWAGRDLRFSRTDILARRVRQIGVGCALLAACILPLWLLSTEAASLLSILMAAGAALLGVACDALVLLGGRAAVQREQVARRWDLLRATTLRPAAAILSLNAVAQVRGWPYAALWCGLQNVFVLSLGFSSIAAFIAWAEYTRVIDWGEVAWLGLTVVLMLLILLLNDRTAAQRVSALAGVGVLLGTQSGQSETLPLHAAAVLLVHYGILAAIATTSVVFGGALSLNAILIGFNSGPFISTYSVGLWLLLVMRALQLVYLTLVLQGGRRRLAAWFGRNW